MTTPTRPSDVQAAIGERPALLGLAGKRIESYVALVNDALALGSLSNDQIEIFNREAEALLAEDRSEEHTSALKYQMRISYAVFCLIKQSSNTITPYRTIVPKIINLIRPITSL